MKLIVKRPLITEKTMALAGRGWFTFEVEKNARKDVIAREVARLYNVQVREVRSVLLPAKTRRVGRRLLPREKPARKKAMVRLAEGQKIPVFETAHEGST